jgi:hypothetical protein
LICKLNCDFNRYIFRTLLSTKSISTPININGYVSHDCISKHKKMYVILSSWLYGSWLNFYLSNKCLSQLSLWVRITIRQGVLDTTLCDKVCQWLVTGRGFTPISSTNKTDRHDTTEIFLNVVLTITITPNHESHREYCLWIVFIQYYCTFFVIISGHQMFISLFECGLLMNVFLLSTRFVKSTGMHTRLLHWFWPHD